MTSPIFVPDAPTAICQVLVSVYLARRISGWWFSRQQGRWAERRVLWETVAAETTGLRRIPYKIASCRLCLPTHLTWICVLLIRFSYWMFPVTTSVGTGLSGLLVLATLLYREHDDQGSGLSASADGSQEGV